MTSLPALGRRLIAHAGMRIIPFLLLPVSSLTVPTAIAFSQRAPASAQSVIAGIIVDPQDRPITDAAVVLEMSGGGRLTKRTDAAGAFRFEDIGSSVVTLSATVPGFASLRSTIETARAGSLRLRLAIAGTAESVTVIGDIDPSDGIPPAYAGGEAARGGRLGLLGNTDTMRAPFSISSYTAQAIQNQQAVTVADVLAKDPAIRSTGQTAGILDAFFIRGFPIGEGNLGEIAFDGQYGVAPNYRVFSDYAERVEVIKGPAALLYGMAPNSGVGGVVNIVPKRASGPKLIRLSADYAANSQVAGHIDIARRFGPSRQFGVRFNGSHQQGDTPLDRQSRKADIGSLALDYTRRRFRVSLDAIGQDERFDAPSRPLVMGAAVQVPSAPDGRRNLSQRWEWAKIQDRSILLRAEYEARDNLTLFAGVGGVHTDVSRLFGTPAILNSAGDTTTTPAYFKFDIARASSDMGFRSRFRTAGVRHSVTLQGSMYRDRLDRGFNNGTPIRSNLYDPLVRPTQEVAAPSLVPRISGTDLNGIAFADTLSMFEEHVQVTVGARVQQVKSDNFNPTTGAVTSSYDKRAVTPLVGVVIRPWQKVSFYANRIEGLSKGDIAPPVAANAGEVFAPYKAKQYETGVKFEQGRLLTSLSVFQITKPSGQLTGNVFAVNAEQRNRGIELHLFGEATRRLRLLGGLMLLDGELTRTNNPRTIGRRPVGVPSLQGNLGAEWDTNFIRRLTLTSGVSYTDKQYVDQANTQSIRDWAKCDLGARYAMSVAGKPATFRANVLNVFNRSYWAGVASWGGFVQGAPRTVLLSTTVEF